MRIAHPKDVNREQIPLSLERLRHDIDENILQRGNPCVYNMPIQTTSIVDCNQRQPLGQTSIWPLNHVSNIGQWCNNRKDKMIQ